MSALLNKLDLDRDFQERKVTRGIVRLDRVTSVKRSTKTYDQAKITDIWLDNNLDPNRPGLWWGEVFLEGKTWDVYTSCSSFPKENQTWDSSGLRLRNVDLKLQVTEKVIGRYLEANRFPSSRRNVAIVRDSVYVVVLNAIQKAYPGLLNSKEILDEG